jgi:thioesterase domain-containing protein/malonyl CoA-acyl carrier protein transacylase
LCDFEREKRAAQQFDDTQTRLAKLWSELLRLTEVGWDDDYFALGGNSLLVVSLMARIEAQFGVRLPVSSIIEAPTVTQLARLVQSHGSHNPVVLLREGGQRPPVFLVHDADGETMLYRSLAHHLDPGHAVYGLKPRSMPHHPMLHTRIEDMASFHIQSMRGVQARGPYLLGGLCAGGLIAFEMARQLQLAGEPVALVALMDVADIAAREKPLRWATQRLTRLSSPLEQEHGHAVSRRATRQVGRVLGKARNLTKYLVTSRLQMIGDHTKMMIFHHYLKFRLRLPAFLRDIPVRTAYRFARRRYRPASPFDGELSLIRATSGNGNDEAYVDRYVDPLLGWGARATRGVRAFDVPGGHSSMLQEPNVRVLAEQLQAYMDDVLNVPAPATPLPEHQTVNSPLEPSHQPPPKNVAERVTVGPDQIVSAAVDESTELKFPRMSRTAHLLVVSAPNQESMVTAAERLAERLEELGDGVLSEMSQTLAIRLPACGWRRAVVAGGRADSIERLRKGTGKGVWNSSERALDRPVAFVLAGVGEHAAGAGRGLYESEPAFRAAADRCAEILRPLVGLDIRESMFTASKPAANWLRGDSGVLKEGRVAQPAAFVLDWALAQMWLSWGVKPAAVLGYSVGEYAAAALAGVLRLEDALMLVARRAQWIQELAEPGVMLAVPLTEAEIQPRLGDGLWVAAVNSPQATIVGGRYGSIERLEEELKKAEVVTRRVASDQGSHTPLLDPVRPNLKRLAEGIHRAPPRLPMLSNVTGSWLTESEACDANHWCEHMCRALRFEQGIGELLQNQEQILLEVGPGAGLSAMVRQHPRFRREMMGRVLTSLPGAFERATDTEHVAGSLGRLWVEGVDVDWRGYFAGEDRHHAVPAVAPITGGSPYRDSPSSGDGAESGIESKVFCTSNAC